MRELVPNFFVSTHPAGWKCNECGQLFQASELEAASGAPDAAIRVAFQSHDCGQYRAELRNKAARQEQVHSINRQDQNVE